MKHPGRHNILGVIQPTIRKHPSLCSGWSLGTASCGHNILGVIQPAIRKLTGRHNILGVIKPAILKHLRRQMNDDFEFGKRQ